LLFTYFIDSRIECLNNVEAIQYQCRIWAMSFDCSNVGFVNATPYPPLFAGAF
jgi:hypothetical protein